MGKISEMLKDYKKLNRVSFSMPGHKNGKGIDGDWGSLDVTELSDTDSLHYSDGAVKAACKKISEIYSGDKSYIMVNGSTGGILTMIASVCKRGDKILVSRLCHMSVINACVTLGICPVFVNHKVYDKFSICGEVDINDLKEKLTDDIKAVLLTSPNYFGIVSDIKSISDIVKEKSIPLLVDEAHGAHFFAGENFPANAILLGADMVVQSTHKTLNGLNQSALLHVKSDLVEYERVEEVLTFFQTSSPSYPIAASAEDAVLEVAEDNFGWKKVYSICKRMKEKIQKETNINIPCMDDGFFALDETRLVFNFSCYDITGYEVSEILRKEWNVDIEMADGENIVLIVTPANDEEELEKLERALLNITEKLKRNDKECKKIIIPEMSNLDVTPSEAFYSDSEYIELEKSENRISVKTVTVYPPGVPVLVPGMKINRECIGYLEDCGGEITGMKDGKIKVIKEG